VLQGMGKDGHGQSSGLRDLQYLTSNAIQGSGVLLCLCDLYLIFVTDMSTVRAGLFGMLSIAQIPCKDPLDRQPRLRP
jgi:hypothetical protein